MICAATALVLLASLAAPPVTPLAEAEREQATAWIAAMKKSFRGPYRGIAWFCTDGVVLPPRFYACVPHGGGRQHGVLSDEAKSLAAMGIHVGTVLASLEPDAFIRDDSYRARAQVVEAYLERALSGWVLVSARTYRGFRQAEDEPIAARLLLLEAAKDQEMLMGRRNLLMRLMRAVPYGEGSGLADEVRALAGQLGDEDEPGFGAIRFKIHAMPEPDDLKAVESYVSRCTNEQQAAKAKDLASKMRELYSPQQRLGRLKSIQRWSHDGATRNAIKAFAHTDPSDSLALIRAGAELILTADRAVSPSTDDRGAERNLLLIHTMDLVEQLWIGVTADLAQRPLSRSEAIEVVAGLLQAAGPLGWLSPREQSSAQQAVARLRGGVPRTYAAGIKYLGRVLEWARARLLADLGVALQHYQAVEPRAHAVVDDQLRSSMILPLAALLDRLTKDVEALRGGGHRLLGVGAAGAGSLRGENPGLAIGPLRVVAAGGDVAAAKRSDIVLLHELPPELPPVAGILTVGAAGSLSHVSLLARNLGIPHASVGSEVAHALGALAAGADEPEPRFVLGVSSGRRVAVGLLSALDGPLRAIVDGRQGPAADSPVLHIDDSVLDLKSTELRGLGQISEKDSGVRVGPKAAELGRLKRLFPDRVSDAVVIPFGAFVRHVDRPGPGGEPSPLAVLRQAYAQASSLPVDEAERTLLAQLSAFRQAIAELPFAERFEAQVRAGLDSLGEPGTFGVFVRSDTNVEDLKEFTGAGLNLTVPNRVGYDSVLKAIRRVWASPFSERSFRWRQRLLCNPEHVYPSVVLHRTVPSEISGVMVTTDLEDRFTDAVTVSASEGVAAVVDGGAPETVVIRIGGETHLLTSSRTATRKIIPDPPAEGVVVVRARGLDPLLAEHERQALLRLAMEVCSRIPPRDGWVPWDIEFGFVGQQLHLMQIRPLQASKAAGMHPFLKDLDRRARLPQGPLDLSAEVPR